MNKILTGSCYFFSCYDGFKSKDIDELEIIETDEFKYMRHVARQGRDLFQWRKQPHKDIYINYALQFNIGMVIIQFLIPEFCAAIGFTIEDLPRVKPLLYRLGNKHKYAEIIYNAYIENGSFTLTDEQRDAAYQSYKTSRGKQ